MATNVPEDLTVCAICFETFIKPKYLPCLHTFCERCLASYVQSTTTKYDEKGVPAGFLCPTCRQKVPAPVTAQSVGEWAKTFPVNFMVIQLLDQKATTGKEGSSQKKGEKSSHSPYDEYVDVFKTQEKQITNLLARGETSLQHLDWQKDDVVKQLTDVKKRVDKTLNKLYDNAVDEISKEHKTRKGKLQKRLDELHKHRTSITKTLKNAKDTNKGEFAKSDQLQDLDKEVSKFLEEETKRSEFMKLSFCIDKGLTDLRNISSFGSVHLKEVIFRSATPTLLAEFPVEQGYVSSGVFLRPDRLLLINTVTKSVGIFDTKGKQLSSVTLPEVPWDVTLLAPDLVVITKNSDRPLQLVHIDLTKWSLTLGNRSETKVTTSAVTSLKGNAVVWDQGSNQLLEIEKDGKVSKHGKTKFKVKSLQYLHSDNDRFIYGSDFAGKCVVCFTLAGDEVFRFSHEGLRGPEAIASDCMGNIYVTDFDSDSVIQLTRDGKYIRTILTSKDGIVHPLAIGCYGNRFFVYCYVDPKGFIRIYEMI